MSTFPTERRLKRCLESAQDPEQIALLTRAIRADERLRAGIEPVQIDDYDSVVVLPHNGREVTVALLTHTPFSTPCATYTVWEMQPLPGAPPELCALWAQLRQRAVRILCAYAILTASELDATCCDIEHQIFEKTKGLTMIALQSSADTTGFVLWSVTVADCLALLCEAPTPLDAALTALRWCYAETDDDGRPTVMTAVENASQSVSEYQLLGLDAIVGSIVVKRVEA